MSTFALGPMQVRRSGYGAMQLAGPYAFGPPPDRASARSDRPGSFRLQLVWPVQFTQLPLAPAASPDNVRREATMSTTIRPTAPASVRPGRLPGARQLADVVRRLAGNPAGWAGRVRLNPAGRWYERIHLDDSHEVWVISWLPGQATGFHDHGGSAGAFAVVWGTLMERRVVGATTTGQVLAKPVGAGGARAFGPATSTMCATRPPRRWRSACTRTRLRCSP
jgi:hypothetical protein